MNNAELAQIINERCDALNRSMADVSRSATGQKDAISRIVSGHEPGIWRLQKLCRELGLEFYIGPPRPAASSLFNRGLNKDAPPPDSALAPVADRDLAEILALLADEYEALNDHGRRQLAARFRAAFPELRGGAPLRRVIRYLGWDVIEAPAGMEKNRDGCR